MHTFLAFFIEDPITPALELKTIGFAGLSILLYIGTTIVQYLAKEKLSELISDHKEAVKKGNNDHVELVTKIDGLSRQISELSNVAVTFSRDGHEQWQLIKEAGNQLTANTLRLHDLDKSVNSIVAQQIQIASAQLNQTQTTQKVIEGLIDILQEQSKD